MSGSVQKESADDPDRVDDAVDPRVQVRIVRCMRIRVTEEFREAILTLRRRLTRSINEDAPHDRSRSHGILRKFSATMQAHPS